VEWKDGDGMRHSRAAGFWILGVGVLHCALFVWFGRATLGTIASERFWNAIDPVRERQVLFWALLTGVMALLLGQLALWVARNGKPLPAFLGWQILGLTLVCGILMPVSGGWLFAVPGALIVLGARKATKQQARDGAR
jgi:hypothetical protein